MSQYSHAIPIEHNLPPGPLWPHKHTLEELREIEKSDDSIYSSQYIQDPHKKDGNIFKIEWWGYYTILPPDYEWKAVFCDTALKKEEHNDYTVFQCWAKYNGRIYLIDQYREKILASDLKREFIEFWNKHKGTAVQPNRGAYVEDKASGIQLIQDIQKEGGIPITPVPREKSKVFRANNLVNWIKSGLLLLPESADFIYDYKQEFKKFSPLMTHKHDDQIDPTLDAIEHMLVVGPEITDNADEKNRRKPIAPSRGARLW